MGSQEPPSLVKAYGLGFIGVAIFATSLPISAFGLADWPPSVMSAGRCLIVTPLAALLLFFGKQTWPTKTQWCQITLVCFGVIFGFPFFTVLAMDSLPPEGAASHGGLVLGILPLATAACAHWVTGKKQSLEFCFWAAVGSALIIGYIFMESGWRPAKGDVWLLCAVLSASLAYAVGGQLSNSIPGWAVISWALILGIPHNLTILLVWPPENLSQVTVQGWLALLWAGFMVQYIAFFFWNAGLAMGGVARISQIQLLQIFMTLIIAYFLLGEQISSITGLFASLVFFAVYFGKKSAL